MYQNNPNPEPDFVSGLREGGESGLKWIQRLTDSYGLLLTLSGEGSVTFGKEFLLLHGGDLILLHPGLQHRFQSLKTWDYLWFHFLPRSHVTHALKWPEPIPGVGKISFADGEFQTVRSALLEAHLLEYERPGGWNALACLLLESVLVRGYNRFLNDNSKIAPPIRTAQKLLTERDDSIDQIAASCGISRAALYAKFQAGNRHLSPAVPGIRDAAAGRPSPGEHHPFGCRNRGSDRNSRSLLFLDSIS